MWASVGLVRSNARLKRAQRRLNFRLQELNDFYQQPHITRDLLDLRNLADVAELIIRSALKRKESRGLHYTLDYPELDSEQPPQNTLIAGKSWDPDNRL
jgi:L-aspartate oxidase